MKVLIVGAGMGGLTLAAFLEHSHIEYEIVEKAPDWSHMGFLISIWDSGRDILRKLGLAEEFDKSGTPASRYVLKNGFGETLKSLDLHPFIAEYGSAVTILDRGDLHRLLMSKIGAEKTRMGTSIRSIEQTNGKATVVFSNGSSADYDAVIGADGVHSQVRSLVFKDAIEEYENWRIWYTWVGHEYATTATITEYVDTGRFVIICTAGTKTTAWFFAPADHAIWDETAGRAARLRQLFRNEPALLSGLEHLRDEDLVPTDMLRLKLSRWSSGSTVLLGDAAHSFGPLSGMGTSMAMEDAYTLAAELMRVSSAYPFAKAFGNYEKKRRARIREVETMTRNLRLGTLVKSPLARKLMNIAMVYVPDRYLMRNLAHLMRQEI